MKQLALLLFIGALAFAIAKELLWIVVLIAATVGVGWLIGKPFEIWHKRRNAETARRAALIEHAEREHGQVMRGDPEGIYGNYPPSAL